MKNVWKRVCVCFLFKSRDGVFVACLCCKVGNEGIRKDLLEAAKKVGKKNQRIID
ncbi:Uncharacterized protein APZ42_027665 [Daphnia magna]|uniref:Uncharacterized protein n=1 Tax=Daphnia magna TaxID=35525 RepID=A0A0P5NKB8_9CRUS|nr:Uncharacterized protein APZ42_027665 [Daphnia magna]